MKEEESLAIIENIHPERSLWEMQNHRQYNIEYSEKNVRKDFMSNDDVERKSQD